MAKAHKEEMPKYLITSLLERLQERYNDGARYIGHEDVMVVLMCLILDGEIDTISGR